MTRQTTALAVLMLSGMTLGAMKFYEVMPYQNCFAIQEQGDIGIAQMFINVADTLTEIHIWVGDRGEGEAYNAEVVEADNPLVRVAYQEGVVPSQSWSWLHIPLEQEIKPVRGRTYKAIFTRSGGAPISYAYDPTNSYPYGELRVGGSSGCGETYPMGRDLAMRVYGKANVDEDLFGSHLFMAAMQRCWGEVGEGWEAWAGHAASAGITWSREYMEWARLQTSAHGEFRFAEYFDTAFTVLRQNNIEPLLVLCYSSDWASSHVRSINPPHDTVWDSKSPPRNLFEPAVTSSGTINPDNYWANYVYHSIRRYGPNTDTIGSTLGVNIRHFGIWNEPELSGRFWKVPDTQYYTLTGTDTLRALCSLYTRLVQVTDLAAKAALGDTMRDSIKLYIGSQPAPREVPCNEGAAPYPGDWLQHLIDWGAFDYVEGYEIHPYHTGSDSKLFSPVILDSLIGSARTKMAQGGYQDNDLMIGEIGWHAHLGDEREQRQANAILQTFVVSLAEHMMKGQLQGPLMWFCLPDLPNFEPNESVMGIYQASESILPTGPKKAYHAHSHMAEILPGKRMQGRLLLGEEFDSLVRIYEFEDPADGKRTWVGWADDTAQLDVSIPVRSEVARVADLHYTGNEQPLRVTPDANGWLNHNLTSRPVFITEIGELVRPDLIVDSISIAPETPHVGGPLQIGYRVRNEGTRIPQALPVEFHWNDSLVYRLSVSPDAAPARGQVVTLFWSLDSIPASMNGTGLLRIIVNPDQDFVELNSDGNSSWRRLAISSAAPIPRAPSDSINSLPTPPILNSE